VTSDDGNGSPVPRSRHDGDAFVLGGGGVLGAAEVGMLRALLEHGITPDLVVGTSVGAINGAVVAADPTLEGVGELAELWQSMSGEAVFGGSTVQRLRTAARSLTHLHDNAPLRRLLTRRLAVHRIEDLFVPFQCVAASIERAAEVWFDEGPLVDAVLASCAVPGFFPAVRIGDEHFIDGGIVNSIPVGRAVDLGARTVYVLHVGRIERPLAAPTRPWDVATVSFEVARRHRFARDMAAVPPDVTVHVLPAADPKAPLANLRYRDLRGVTERMERAYRATADHLARLA
jgi:NTE family protein